VVRVVELFGRVVVDVQLVVGGVVVDPMEEVVGGVELEEEIVVDVDDEDEVGEVEDEVDEVEDEIDEVEDEVGEVEDEVEEVEDEIDEVEDEVGDLVGVLEHVARITVVVVPQFRLQVVAHWVTVGTKDGQPQG
jgi:chromosome segregation ATPase